MILVAYKDGKKLFERPYDEYWWVNGFKFGENVNPEDIELHVLITFDTYYERQIFVNAYMEEYGTEGITFAYDNTWDNTVCIDW